MLCIRIYSTILLLTTICTTIMTRSSKLTKTKIFTQKSSLPKQFTPDLVKKNKSSTATIPKQNPSAQPKQYSEKRSPVETMVTNKITNDMLSCKHWSGIWVPSTFILTVNGKKISQGEKEPIIIKGNRLEIRYDYSFLKGKYKGAKIVLFEMEKNAQDINISFSWNNEWHIIVDHAKPKKINPVTFFK